MPHILFSLPAACAIIQDAPELLATPAPVPCRNPTTGDRKARNKVVLQAFSTDMPWDPFRVPSAGLWQL